MNDLEEQIKDYNTICGLYNQTYRKRGKATKLK